MVDDPIPEAGQPQTPDTSQPQSPRRGRRSGRGHRGRGRRRKQMPKPHVSPQTEEEPSSGAPEDIQPIFESSGEAGETDAPAVQEPSAEAITEPDRAEHYPPQPPPRDFQTAPKASIQRSIQQVNDIVDSLRESLEDMEEVLETLETFERQGNADEREIESLRRALRHLQRPREGGGHHRGHG